MRIRLAGIDAPESHQPYGTRAQQGLPGFAFGKDGRIDVQGKDRYGRRAGTLFIGALTVNQEMVRRGAARVYTQYNRDLVVLRLQAQARECHVGL
nr:thermonuclease family protein [Pseudoroseomonas deserti]